MGFLMGASRNRFIKRNWTGCPISVHYRRERNAERFRLFIKHLFRDDKVQHKRYRCVGDSKTGSHHRRRSPSSVTRSLLLDGVRFDEYEADRRISGNLEF
jgi:hypothetical protein